MWNRSELKRKAKASFKLNYWKTVLISLLVASIVGAGSAAGSASGLSSMSSTSNNNQATIESTELTTSDIESWAQSMDDIASDPNVDPSELVGLIDEFNGINTTGSPSAATLPPAVAIALLVMAVAIVAVAIIVEALILNPLEVGTARFFLTNLSHPAEVKEAAFGYDHNYRQNVKTLLWRDIYIILWSLLLVVPGIIKSYEYRMIPYLLSENETMTKKQAFAESKRMMRGQKWRTFVLDLSFIGWYLLTALTLGLLGIFYVNPYKRMTDAALYEKLRHGAPIGGDHFVRAAAPAAPSGVER